MDYIVEKLFALQDLKYLNFTASLNPTVNKETIIGVRIPTLRKLAKEVGHNEHFISSLPHRYYEENLIHRFMLENCTNFEKTLQNLDNFLPFLNSWSLTDGFKNKTFKKNKDLLFKKILVWLESDNIYSVRFAVCLLMSYFLDPVSEEILHLVETVPTKNEYYIQMAVAWFYQTAFVKNFDLTYSVFSKSKLDKFTFNKTISKCCDSFVISDEEKFKLKQIRRKK